MLSDKPLAMSLRVYGDTLMVGNVRLTDGPLAGGGFPLTALGGRYKNVGEKGIPKPKAMKVNDHPLCPPVAQAMPSPYPAGSGPVPTAAYDPAPFVGGILSTEYSTYPYPIGNPPVNPYGPPGAAIGLPPQPMQYPPPPVECAQGQPGEEEADAPRQRRLELGDRMRLNRSRYSMEAADARPRLFRFCRVVGS